ncbi:hypothetical protein ACEQ8H_006160 [Pleosporales sp. CAS-2024a]
MSKQEDIAMQEQVGLLKQDEANTRQSIESSEEDSLPKEERRVLTLHRAPQRPWAAITTVAVLMICTLGVLLHFALAFRKKDTGRGEHVISAHLRSEDDYILDPAWDFSASPTVREFTWIIGDHELNPDGVYRPMVLINSTFPGPLLECNEGDELVVHVINSAVNATSIHWHGLFQNGTNWMDGTVGVTQCPIAPGQSFTYRFNATGQSGTYYYHSHMSMQASDGVVGPLVIHARDEQEKVLQQVPYEQDRVVMLSDYYYDLSSELLMQYLAPGSENDEPVPPSALINGRNMRECSDLPNRNCSSSNASHALFGLSTTSNTRLRILNVGAFAEFSFQIDEHEFHVTEVDGTDVHPQSIHRLNINPAQRYSIILIPPQHHRKDMYWMRARMITHCFAYENPELQEEVWGILDYTNKRHDQRKFGLTPQTKDWSQTIEVECRDLNTTLLSPVLPMAAPETADHSLFLRSSFQIRNWALSRGYLNDSSWRIDATKPVLNSLLDSFTTQGISDLQDGINTALFDPNSQMVYQTFSTATIDILLQNFDDGVHPFHLHGYKFFVMANGHGYPPSSIYEPGFLNITNPLRRDTVSLEAFGWLLIRFVADNPGAWPFHCHVGWHNEAGLGMLFVTMTEEMKKWGDQRDLRGVQGLCAMTGLEKGMGPDDDIWEGSIDQTD